MTLQVFLVDDEPAVRDALALVLSTYGYATETYDSAPALLAGIGDRPGCVIADIRLPGMDGLELQEKLAAAPIRRPVILITGHGDVPMAVRALKAGAIDFLEKPVDDAELVASVRRAQPEAALAASAYRLTAREREVVAMLVEGLTGTAMAERLGISPRTIEHYRAAAMEKLGAGSIPQLVRLALQAGIGR